MINFRVADLDAIVQQLRDAGETVEVDPERYPNGRFAELRDPESNGVQLCSRWDRRSPCAGTYALALSREGWETGRMEAIG